MVTLPAILVLQACMPFEATRDTLTEPTPGTTNPFPLPDDLDEIDWPAVFQEAVEQLKTINTQVPWGGHLQSLESRQAGCPDFWVDRFTVGNNLVGDDNTISWYDDCSNPDTSYFDGLLTWTSDVLEEGDPATIDGRTSEGFRSLTGDAIVGDDDGLRFSFNGGASDSLYRLEADGYSRLTYSTNLDNVEVGGRDALSGTATPDGFRSDLFMFLSGGDVDTFEARGNVYFFTPQLHDRFDSIQLDMALVGPSGAGPNDCLEEPLGWIGVRDENAYWYDVVFLPRFQEDVVGDPYANDPLSQCDGCGRLYVQGVEQPDVDVCVDFSFVFDGGFPLPDADDYVLPFHAL